MAADPIPPTAFDPGIPGAAFTPGDFYQAYLNDVNFLNASGLGTVPGVKDVPVTGPGGTELFGGIGGAFFDAPKGATFTSGGDQDSASQLKPLNSSQFLNTLENEQLASFIRSGAGTEDSSRGLGGLLEQMAPNLASIAAILGSAGIAGSVLPALLSTTGTLVGGKVGGPTGATVGGAVGGLAGGQAAGSLSDTPVDISTQPDLGGLTGAGGGTAAALGKSVEAGLAGAATGGATAGVNPGSGSSGTGAPGGGSGAGSSLGTDPSTGQGISGGASGAASTPGSSALGTGASAQQSSVAANVFKDFNDLSTAARFATQLDALTGGSSAGSAQETPAQPQQQLPSNQTSAFPLASAAPQPVSQIASSAPTTGFSPSAFPSGEMQSITQDFVNQTQNSIRAQFANQNISGSPMEETQLQGVQAQANQRSQAAQQAMTAAGVSDPNVFAALMVSNVDPAQFGATLQQLRARNAI